MFRRIVTSILILVPLSTLPALSEWGRTYGLRHPMYPDALFLTGFAMVQQRGDEGEILTRTKEAALTDLIQKISVHIRSETVITDKWRESSQGERASIEVDTRTVTTSDMEVGGVDYAVESENGNIYVLALIRRSDLLQFYIQKGKRSLSALEEVERGIDRSGGQLTLLYDTAIQGLPLVTAIEKTASHHRIVGSMKDNGGYYTQIGTTGEKFAALKKRIEAALAETGGIQGNTFEEALEKIAVALKTQGVRGTIAQSPPLTFQESMLSSEFGAYAAEALRGKLGPYLSGPRETLRIKGNYRQEGERIRLNILALSTGGKHEKSLGLTTVTFPAAALKGRFSLKPRNYDQAVAALREFSEGAITDGGISIEVWSQKGRSGENLVFEEGEEFQLYLRVNQPAFLRITYRLATGEYVLLEPSYYIGIDRVSQPVRFPHLFEVVPPLGVEQLIITGFSQEPGEALTETAVIDGQKYEVYKGMGEVVARIRGLKKKQRDGQTDQRVGETMLSITTVERIE